MKKTCRTCKHWGPRCCFDPAIKQARAVCTITTDSYLTMDDDACDNWIQREGEPLGVGVSKWWFLSTSHKFTPAAIIHDFHYDTLKQYESTRQADREFLENCLLLSKDGYDRAEAYLFYAIVRVWGIYKQRIY